MELVEVVRTLGHLLVGLKVGRSRTALLQMPADATHALSGLTYHGEVFKIKIVCFCLLHIVEVRAWRHVQILLVSWLVALGHYGHIFSGERPFGLVGTGSETLQRGIWRQLVLNGFVPDG